MANVTVEFVIGDIVSLASGGPDMTVGTIEGDKITCYWFDHGLAVNSFVFQNEMLVIEE